MTKKNTSKKSSLHLTDEELANLWKYAQSSANTRYGTMAHIIYARTIEEHYKVNK